MAEGDETGNDRRGRSVAAGLLVVLVGLCVFFLLMNRLGGNRIVNQTLDLAGGLVSMAAIVVGIGVLTLLIQMLLFPRRRCTSCGAVWWNRSRVCPVCKIQSGELHTSQPPGAELDAINRSGGTEHE